jgi:hypothetical protein
VPALTFGVSTNFAPANFLASRSFGNVLVALTRFRFPRGSSNETYHVPLDLLAVIPSRGLRGRGPQSKANEIVPLATCQPSGFVFRRGRCPDSLPSRNAPAVLMESWRAIGYSSLFNFRFAQCISLQDELNVRST